MEACYSGSMFHDVLPSNMGVFVTTSAKEDEQSWSAFCHDKRINICLANEYSYAWITDSQYKDLKKRTLDQQYEEVDKRT
ncbi:hemoglobinase, partial [Clonorchis sinensis]